MYCLRTSALSLAHSRIRHEPCEIRFLNAYLKRWGDFLITHVLLKQDKTSTQTTPLLITQSVHSQKSKAVRLQRAESI